VTPFYWLVLGVLTTWRITHFLNAEDGPGDVVVRLRARLGDGALGKMLDCFYCLSIWIALPLALAIGRNWAERAALVFALSAGAILLQRATEKSS
jgi:hypothetical protein